MGADSPTKREAASAELVNIALKNRTPDQINQAAIDQIKNYIDSHKDDVGPEQKARLQKAIRFIQGFGDLHPIELPPNTMVNTVDIDIPDSSADNQRTDRTMRITSSDPKVVNDMMIGGYYLNAKDEMKGKISALLITSEPGVAHLQIDLVAVDGKGEKSVVGTQSRTVIVKKPKDDGDNVGP